MLCYTSESTSLAKIVFILTCLKRMGSFSLWSEWQKLWWGYRTTRNSWCVCVYLSYLERLAYHVTLGCSWLTRLTQQQEVLSLCHKTDKISRQHESFESLMNLLLIIVFLSCQNVFRMKASLLISDCRYFTFWNLYCQHHSICKWVKIGIHSSLILKFSLHYKPLSTKPN